jgi:leader peptidase (prepilin peptidase)/N-methyltransferase
MEISSVMVVYSALFGLALGSFMNVCIYRIPLKKSIVSPPSSCPNCGERIRFYDNIPVISYLLLLGKCRHCSNPLAWHYPLVEALTGLLSVALFIRYGLSYQYFLYLLFTSVLVTVSFIDLHHKIIPDVLSLSGIVVGWAVSFMPGTISWLDSLIGIIAGGGSLFLVAFIYERITGREGMGGGDIKLLAMIGAWLGWRQLYLVVLISSLVGAIVGIAFLLMAGKGFRVRIPFGPFLSLGAMVCLFFGPELMNWYSKLLQ